MSIDNESVKFLIEQRFLFVCYHSFIACCFLHLLTQLTSLKLESGNNPRNPRTKSSLDMTRSPLSSFEAYFKKIARSLSVGARFRYDGPLKMRKNLLAS